MIVSKEPKSKEEIFMEIEKLSKACDNPDDNLDLFSSLSDDNDFQISDKYILEDTANPQKSHRLYYGIRKLLIDHLPKGKGKNKEFREKIYEEKNLFLNRGEERNSQGIRGSDGRMTYIPNFLSVAYNTIIKWIGAGANPIDIYKEFWELNEEKGFHKPSVQNHSKPEEELSEILY